MIEEHKGVGPTWRLANLMRKTVQAWLMELPTWPKGYECSTFSRNVVTSQFDGSVG